MHSRFATTLKKYRSSVEMYFKMMRRLLFALLFFVPVLSMAQTYEDVVYLQNGGILRGKVLPNDDSTTVKVEILGGSVFVVASDDVKYVKKERSQGLAPSKGPVTISQKGMWGEINMGLPVGRDVFGNFVVGFSTNFMVGYQFQPKFRLGYGTGIDVYNFGATFFPNYLRISGDFFEKPITPIYFLDLGYGSALKTDVGQVEYTGGFLTNVGTGFKFHTRGRAYWKMSIAYKTQAAKETRFDFRDGISYETRTRFNRIEYKLALGF